MISKNKSLIITNNTKILLFISIFFITLSVILLFVPMYKFKSYYSIYLNYILDPLLKYKYDYFYQNFNQIIQPYLKSDIITNNNSININRNVKNEYALLDKEITKDIFHDLNNLKENKKSLNKLIKNLLNYVHLDGKKIKEDDLILLDVLNLPGNYYPFFHTDTEWNTFCMNDGFQIWILLEEDKDISPRGNMFIMETNIVEPGRNINIQKDQVNIEVNGTGVINPKVIRKYKSLKDINPTIRYLNAKVGEVFIMNQNVFHCSDPFKLNCNRKAVNLRLVHKPKDNLKICNSNNNDKNYYTNYLLSMNKFKCENNYCMLNSQNQYLKYKFI